MSYALLIFGILIFGVGIWSRVRGSRLWRMRMFVGMVFILSWIHLVWRS